MPRHPACGRPRRYVTLAAPSSPAQDAPARLSRAVRDPGRLPPRSRGGRQDGAARRAGGQQTKPHRGSRLRMITTGDTDARVEVPATPATPVAPAATHRSLAALWAARGWWGGLIACGLA